MLKASQIFSGVRALVDDPEMDYATDDALAPLLQIAIESLVNACLNNPNIGRMKAIVEVANVPAGTKSLKDYFAAGKALELLETIVSMKEKATGADQATYLRMDPVIDLPVVAQLNFNGVYVETGDDILLPGASQALDFRIFGTFDPAVIKNGDSPVIPGTSLILKLNTAALISRPHGNTDLATDYAQQAELERRRWMNHLIMEMQNEPTRQRAFGRGSSLSQM